MPDTPEQPERHRSFFDVESDRKREEIYRPPSILRTTEWGLLTVTSLLAALAFPPYFISALSLAFFNAGGMLWITHLSERGRQRLKEFEKEFSEGHRLEEAGHFGEAIQHYSGLIPHFQDFPKIAEIARRRIDYLKAQKPSVSPRAKRRKKSPR
jgi:hypothetical protein